MPSILLLDYIREPLVTDEGVIPPWGYSQDDDMVLAGVLKELRKAKLVASARQGPFGEVRELPADFWNSICRADVDWKLSAVPTHGLVAVRIRRAYQTTQSMPDEIGNRRGSSPRSNGGREPEYDWDAFKQEAIRVLEDEGLPTRTNERGWRYQADLERRLTTWCQENWSDVPSESMIRNHVGKAVGEYKKGREGL